MYKIFFIGLLYLFSHTAVSQTMIPLEEYDKKRDEVRDLTDSIGSINSILKEKNKEISTFKKNFGELSVKHKEESDRNNILKRKLEQTESNLIRTRDSLVTLASTIILKEETIQTQYNESQKKEQKIESDFIKKINNVYDKELDDITENFNFELLERDKNILINSNKSQTLRDLDNYFAALNVLNQKHEQSLIDQALTNLKNIKSNSSKTEHLRRRIENYFSIQKDLRVTFEKIKTIGENEPANTTKTQELVLTKILMELSSFITDYEYSFKDYPYLTNQIEELLIKKQINANADISNLIENLK